MSVSVVQSNAQKIAGTPAAMSAFGTEPTAGNAILVCVNAVPTGGSCKLRVTDNATGNSYSLLAASECGVGSVNPTTTTISNPTICWFGASNINTTSSFTVTVDTNSVGTADVTVEAMEVSGLGTSFSTDGSGSANHGTNSTTATTGTFSTTNSVDLILLGLTITYNGSSNPTVSSDPSGYTLFNGHLNDSTGPALGRGDYLITSSAQSSVDPTWSGTNFGSGWASIAIALEAASGSPSAPTLLSASYVSSSEVGLSWTNPSGTLTDNKVQYSTDGNTWTTVDIGSAVTSYTLTGLTANTVYVFQVAAVSSGGTSAYSFPCLGATAPFMVLGPATDYSTTNWSKTGSGYSTSLNTGSDTSYVSTSQQTGGLYMGTASNPPAGFDHAVGAYTFVRGAVSGGTGTQQVQTGFFLDNTNASSGQISTVSETTVSSTFSNYVNNVTPSPWLTGTDAGTWTSAELALGYDYSGGSAGTLEVSQLMGIVTYSGTPNAPPINPNTMYGGGLTRAQRSHRVEGTVRRYQG